MVVAALRRFLLLLAAVVSATLVGSGLLALAAGSELRRSLTVGFYLAGSFLLITGFFLGNRGRLRADRAPDDAGVPLLRPRRVRAASEEEERESVATSAVVIALGVALLLVAVVVDAQHELV